MASVVLNGATSGQITLAPAAVAGTNTITFPASTGTVLVTSGGGASFSNVVLNGSSSGSTTLQPSAVASGTVTLPAGTGTVAVQGVSTNIVQGTSNAGGTNPFPSSAGPTSVAYTNIPSWVKRITVMFDGVSTSGTSNIIVQLGTGATPTYVITGYTGATATQTGAVITNFTSGFIVNLNISAADVFSGQMVINNLASNTWSENSNIGYSSSAASRNGAGSVSLGALLTAIRITTASPGTDLFDAGSINILYE
jgi:hypothetical protein